MLTTCPFLEMLRLMMISSSGFTNRWPCDRAGLSSCLRNWREDIRNELLCGDQCLTVTQLLQPSEVTREHPLGILSLWPRKGIAQIAQQACSWLQTVSRWCHSDLLSAPLTLSVGHGPSGARPFSRQGLPGNIVWTSLRSCGSLFKNSHPHAGNHTHPQTRPWTWFP